MAFLDPSDGLFIEGRTPNLDVGWCAEPIEKPLPRAAMTAAESMDERRGFVPALVARKPQKWQGYLRFGERPCVRRRAGFARRADGFAGLDFFAPDTFEAAFFDVPAERARLSLGAR